MTRASHPLLLAGRSDRRLRNHLAFHVLSAVVEVIPDGEERVIQVTGLAAVLEIHRDTVKRALRTLVQRGYLVKGEKDARGSWAYTLATNVPTPWADKPLRTVPAQEAAA